MEKLARCVSNVFFLVFVIVILMCCPITLLSIDEILEKVEQDKHITTVDIGMNLDIDQTVLNHLQKIGFKERSDIWISHKLRKT